MNNPTPRTLIDDADSLLLDSKHPLDEHQARRMTLMLLREILNEQLVIKRDVDNMKRGIDERRTALDDNIAGIKKDVDALWTYVRQYPSLDAVEEVMRQAEEYPSLTWLLRYRTKATVTWIVLVIVIILMLFLTYQNWLLARLGLPPIVIP